MNTGIESNWVVGGGDGEHLNYRGQGRLRSVEGEGNNHVRIWENEHYRQWELVQRNR